MTFTEKWLKGIAITHIIGGMLLPIMVFTPIAAPYFNQLLEAFPQGDLTSMKFLIGVFGPTVASWGLLFYYGVGKAFQSKTPKDWWFLVFAILAWVLLDTVYSLFFNVISHLYINGAIALLLITPLIFQKSKFSAQ
ncbi:hypothetical protein [Kangiella sediminilitoris]|uniref:Uncharacterized protein n=1 Tax=Kangiella sediminilitoris TaxID=1144748 RepID=A0A1B3BCU7_9GAMM|nr:hypothetical protein [Kangiella sediminilitoris]AOE50578.1 hypothetical protein KS2013_1869 [Kangiella sediminilitoris]